LNKLAPIVLFVYNRPDHTKRTIEALQKNELASESELYIYSDAPKNKEDEKQVKEVRSYIHEIDGFKKVTIIEREKNWGLADSIIDGVTKIVNEYGKIIVLEDDLVTSPCFLRFMNDALEYYEDEKRVWHISGWNYPIRRQISPKTFLWKKMNCWGWATWDDRWSFFEKNPSKFVHEFPKEKIREFDLDGVENNWQQLLDNMHKKIDTWAVFWHLTIFKHDGLCLNPVTSFIDNIGLDGSGTHCTASAERDAMILNTNSKMELTKQIAEHQNVKTKVIEQLRYKSSLRHRIKRKLKKILFQNQC